MKRYLKITSYFFAGVSIAFTVISLVIKRNLNLDRDYIRLTLGAFAVSLILALSYAVFKCKKGNPVLNTVLSFLIVLPSVFVLRAVFGLVLFRFSFIIYIATAACGIIYAIILLAVKFRSANEEKSLNRLLKGRDSNTVGDTKK